MSRFTKIGIISDTHGLLRGEAVEALQGVDHIIHAGDVGGQEILDQLAVIAPVTVVRGNTDYGDFGSSLPKTEVYERDGRYFYIVHDIADLDVEATEFAAVIYGHSHKPLAEKRGGTWFLNPGSAGPRRFKLPVCLFILTLFENSISTEQINLLD
ncbi:MAG: metallophosphoesterase family protein [Calditrichota bacterium]